MSESLGSSLCSICKNICLTSFIYFFDTLSASWFLHYPSMRGHHPSMRGHHPSRQLIQPLRGHSPSLRVHQLPPHLFDHLRHHGKLHVPIPHGKGSPVVAWHGQADEAGLPVRGSHVALELGVDAAVVLAQRLHVGRHAVPHARREQRVLVVRKARVGKLHVVQQPGNGVVGASGSVAPFQHRSPRFSGLMSFH